jgi:hypothetical protein
VEARSLTNTLRNLIASFEANPLVLVRRICAVDFEPRTVAVPGLSSERYRAEAPNLASMGLVSLVGLHQQLQRLA